MMSNFSAGEPKHVALLEINPVRQAENSRVLFRPLGALTF
jgi:hypothetical protein